MRPLCISTKLLLLLFLTLLLPRDGAASTSSTLLRHGKITSGRIPSAIGKRLKHRHELLPRGRQSLTRRRALVPTGKTSAFASPTSSRQSYSISPAFVGNSAAVRSGFRQFSQRATRLQGRSQKPFSLRAIFGDVVTNNSEGDHPVWPVAKRVQPVLSALTNIAATAASEALGGFLGGYLLGATSLSTKRLYRGIRRAAAAASSHNQPRAVATPTCLLPYSSLTKFSQQSLQFHAHNMAWATEWAKISALFGACRMVVKTLRHDDQDDDGWNAVVGSAMAGALLAAPTKSPPMVLKHALLYGGTMFLLHPNLWKQGMEAVWLTLPPVVVDNQPWYDAIGI